MSTATLFVLFVLVADMTLKNLEVMYPDRLANAGLYGDIAFYVCLGLLVIFEIVILVRKARGTINGGLIGAALALLATLAFFLALQLTYHSFPFLKSYRAIAIILFAQSALYLLLIVIFTLFGDAIRSSIAARKSSHKEKRK